ncbi:class I lanthipeptide [Kordia sp.]|uniref:class I lanthipeptide n=1 Tax=Kordia sp. TaxID=1965332 RepID=UPI003D2A79B0
MKKKFSRSLMLNKKSVASLASNVKKQIVGGNDDNTQCETCEVNCIPDTVEPSCAGTCWYSDCHCGGDDRYTNGSFGQGGWGDCS